MQPKVGVGVFCFKPTGEFILGKRKGSIGAGTFALPGGHLEFGESFEQCAARELLEETGLTVGEKDMHFLTAGNNVFKEEGQHYVTIAMGCILPPDAEPKVTEPEKCEGWQWITWDTLCEYARNDLQSDGQKMLFLPMVDFVTQREGFDPFMACQNTVPKSEL